MKIHSDFIGGNIKVISQTDNEIFLENELRDTTQDWFYWAFCVEGAEGKTVTFNMQENRLGYYGPAVSHDLKNWHWLDSVDKNSFTYSFAEGENRVYFAHSFLYHPERFLRFADKHNLEVRELCKGYKGSSVPCVSFGNGEISVILTARHHACESTGNYVLEGVLEELFLYPEFKVFCVPFVDYEGVIRGDQGKSRNPHDHNRDYTDDSIYPECTAIKKYALQNGCRFGFDFHSPWHIGNENDNVFIVQKSFEKLGRLNRFGEILEDSITEESLKYYHKNDYPFMTGWNQGAPTVSVFLNNLPENEVAFTLETAYFGTKENKVSAERLVELGRCFAKAIKCYVRKVKI